MEKLNEDFLIYAIVLGMISIDKTKLRLEMETYSMGDEKIPYNSLNFEIINEFQEKNWVFYLARLKTNLSFIDQHVSYFRISLKIGTEVSKSLFEENSSKKHYFQKESKNKIQFLLDVDLNTFKWKFFQTFSKQKWREIF